MSDCTKVFAALHCTGHSNEPLKPKNAEAMASTFFESHFHGANVVSSNTFVRSDSPLYRRGFCYLYQMFLSKYKGKVVMSYDCYHSYPQLLQWKVLCLLVPKIPHTAVLTTLEVAEIFFRFCDWQVGHLGLFCHSLATAFARAICSGEGGGPISSLKILKASSAVFSSHLKKTLMY